MEGAARTLSHPPDIYIYSSNSAGITVIILMAIVCSSQARERESVRDPRLCRAPQCDECFNAGVSTEIVPSEWLVNSAGRERVYIYSFFFPQNSLLRVYRPVYVLLNDYCDSGVRLHNIRVIASLANTPAVSVLYGFLFLLHWSRLCVLLLWCYSTVIVRHALCALCIINVETRSFPYK